jgi:ElaA protein
VEITFSSSPFESLTTLQLYKIYKLRSEVFVVEQTCAYQDIDDIDLQALHLCGWQNEELISYARLISPGISYDTCSIGRVVVSPTKRGLKLGVTLMQEAIQLCKIHFKATVITISAQYYLLAFYESLGFTSKGETYLEDDIPHIKMIYNETVIS